MQLIEILVPALLICGIVYFGGIRPLRRHRREQSLRAKADAHLDSLRKGVEEIADQDPATDVQATQQQPIHLEKLSPGMQVFSDTRECWDYPPKKDDVLEAILPGDEVGGGWDYAVHIHEGAEQYLGSEQFLTLEGRFASVPGVDECKHEDREVFLIRAKALTADELSEACWTQFMNTAEQAFEKVGQH